jgi:hypothetical protein
MTRPTFLFAVIYLLAGQVLPCAAGIRTFTATDGRTIEATLVGKTATTATIRSATDGRDYTLPLDRFNEADRKFISAWELPVAANPPAAGSVKEALEQAKEFGKSGEQARALERFEWIASNAAAADPSDRMRMMAAYDAWANLGTTYPPALESLRNLRAEKAASLLAGKGGREVFADLAAIDRSITTVDSASAGATARFFKSLDAAQPELARECFVPAMQDLWKTGEVEVFAKHATDLRQSLEARLADYKAQYEVLKTRDAGALITRMKEELDDYTRFLVQAAEAQDQSELGNELRAMTEKILNEDA